MIPTFYRQKGKTQTGVIDLKNKDFKCENIAQFPEGGLQDCAGGMIDGTIYVCGGFMHGLGFNSKCWKIENKLWKTSFPLKIARLNSAYSVLGNKLAISGGRSSYNAGFGLTEVMTKEGTNYNVNIGYAILGHCQVTWNATTYLIIGGNNGIKKTTFVNIEDQKTSPGPDLKQGRASHGCTELELNDKQYVIVTGGMADGSRLKTVEYLSKEQPTEWEFGTEFPVAISNHEMVASHSKTTVYTIGGIFTPGGITAHVYESSCPNDSVASCTFTKTDVVVDLDQPEHLINFVPITISNEMAEELCN